MLPVVGTPRLARETFFSADMPEEQVKRYFERLQDESYRAYLDMLGPSLPRPSQVKTPPLVLGAADDRTITPREIEATAHAYGIQAEILPDLAHDVMLEPGWQRVADRILAWREQRGTRRGAEEARRKNKSLSISKRGSRPAPAGRLPRESSSKG